MKCRKDNQDMRPVIRGAHLKKARKGKKKLSMFHVQASVSINGQLLNKALSLHHTQAKPKVHCLSNMRLKIGRKFYGAAER